MDCHDRTDFGKKTVSINAIDSENSSPSAIRGAMGIGTFP
jgi:hypothetical protein